tara:strand:- start:3355 stop:4110 length:756 start_codon:yes stop_codon:yes gene_type:complete
MVKISPDFAELCGIHAGDGYLRNDGKRRELDISGNIEEREYYLYHVIPIFNKAFNLKLKGKFFPYRNTYGFVLRDRNVIQLFHKVGFPYGSKSTTVSIPEAIMDSNNINLYKRFLRGYFDTDGCVTFDKKIYNKDPFKISRNYYPRLCFATCSYKLAKDFKYIASILGFDAAMYKYIPKKITENIKYPIQICGKNSLEKWMKLIGSKNPTKISRYLIWRKFSFCPPNTTYGERLKILKGELNPNIFYGPVT